MNRIAGVTHVLDEFHLEKYLTKLTSHMKDSKADAADELRTVIRSKTKADFSELVEKLEDIFREKPVWNGWKKQKHIYFQTGQRQNYG